MVGVKHLQVQSSFKLCSACSSVAYCGAQCQGESWPCKKMKRAPWGLKMDLVSNSMMTKAGVVRMLD